jgi:Family of unknown function (DUF6129)
MALGVDDLTVIDELLSAAPAEGKTFSELRQRFPHLSWTRCDASDVVEVPFRTYGQFDLHLLDSADHCVRITTDPTQATGIILARRNVSA